MTASAPWPSSPTGSGRRLSTPAATTDHICRIPCMSWQVANRSAKSSSMPRRWVRACLRPSACRRRHDTTSPNNPFSEETAHMDINDKIHAQLVKAGVRLAASLPDDWVNTLIRRISKDNQIHHVPVCREAETIAICAGAFFGGVRAVAIFGNTGLLTCTGEMATLCLRHAIPVFCIVSGRGSIDDHKVYQEVQGRRTIPLLQAYDYPYRIIDRQEEIEDIPNAYEWHRLQKRPFVLFLTKKLLGTAA